MRNSFYHLVLVVSMILPSCGTINSSILSADNIPGVYSLAIHQGNIIDQKMIDKLRPKMTKRQVLYIMGSSMLIDVFHQQRWDYIYSAQPSGEPRTQKRIALFFDGDQLAGIQGDYKPVASLATEQLSQTIEVPKRNLDITWWGKFRRAMNKELPLNRESYGGGGDGAEGATETNSGHETQSETPGQ